MTTSQRLLAVFWIGAGLNHFVNPKFYEAIMPPYLPAHRELVLWSGVAEVVGGAAVVWPKTRTRFARCWILGILAAVFPANLYMAQHPEKFSKVPAAALYARLPVQLLFALWVWRATAPSVATEE